MDCTRFSDIPVIDAHVHFRHPERVDGVLALMDAAPYVRVNLVSTLNPRTINDNAALIYFKAHHPRLAYISGALDYTRALTDRDRASELLSAQVRTLKAIGFDGLKFIEGKPGVRKRIPIPFDAPEYEDMWTAMEELGMPAVFHLADPEERWYPEYAPARAGSHRHFYDPTFPTKEELYTEIDHVLERHPGLKLIFAHFYFLSADLARAGEFLDAHPGVCFDLTPGPEMYNRFSQNHGVARDFIIRHGDRIVYGTDTSSGSLERGNKIGMETILAKVGVVRTMLETDSVFAPPEELGSWLQPPTDAFRGLALPRSVLKRIYHTNLERMYGHTPAPLNRAAAIAELERMATSADALPDGDTTKNEARSVADLLRAGIRLHGGSRTGSDGD